MASRRSATQLARLALHTSRLAVRSTCPTLVSTQSLHLSSSKPSTLSQLLPVRYYSSSSSSTPEADPPSDIASHDFSSISKIVSTPSPSRVLVDVREPAELEASGRIPGAQNMPINSAPDGLFLPAEEFEDRFGFAKPKADQEVVFYCKAGVRSRAAARVARMAGYQNVGEYPGSWVDWAENGGKIEK